MKTGTKSLLFGVHQFLWHPITVWIAWVWLYRRLPNLKETICIVVHDWGYWGKANMDDAEGETHPLLGSRIAHALLDEKVWPPKGYELKPLKRTIYRDLCLYHSRHYARRFGVEPSPLCWADKLSTTIEPWWLYLPRAWASGELQEYRIMASAFVPLTASHREWYRWVQARMSKVAHGKRGDVVPYLNPERT